MSHHWRLGKTAVGGHGRPLYGDVFGAQQTAPEESFRPEDTGGHWGELPDEDDEDDYDDDEGSEAVGGEEFAARTVQPPRREEVSSSDASETRRASRRPWMRLVRCECMSRLDWRRQSIDLRKERVQRRPNSPSTKSGRGQGFGKAGGHFIRFDKALQRQWGPGVDRSGRGG